MLYTCVKSNHALRPRPTGVILGGPGPDPTFLESEDGPPLYKYIKSEILLCPPHFSNQSYATA